jgi:hypothetical protein
MTQGDVENKRNRQTETILMVNDPVSKEPQSRASVWHKSSSIALLDMLLRFSRSKKYGWVGDLVKIWMIAENGLYNTTERMGKIAIEGGKGDSKRIGITLYWFTVFQQVNGRQTLKVPCLRLRLKLY